jgi:acyl-coenzyme A synthetase/AMP-(fatty) acid ligase
VIRCGKYPALLNPYLNKEEIEFALTDLKSNNVYTEEKFLTKIPTYFESKVLSDNFFNKSCKSNSGKIWDSPLMKENWAILYSSGTTGTPKGIIRSHFSILSELLGWCFELETRANSHYYIGRPVYYTGGLVLTLSALLVGGKVSLYDTFNPELYFKLIENEETHLSFLIPSQITLLIDYLKKHNIVDPPNSQAILSMGAPFTEYLKISARRYLKSDIIESWGNTEGLGTITTQSDLELRPSSIGRPFLSDELFVVDENFKRVLVNTIGRLAGRVDSRFTEYNNLEELSNQFIHDDLIISEDLGMEDEFGYFYLFGRINDMIVTESCKIYPIVIEKIISSFEQVEEVAVLGINENTKIIIACIVKLKSDSIDLNDLLNQINSKLNPEQQISQIKSILNFPKTASGKIKKRELKALFK